MTRPLDRTLNDLDRIISTAQALHRQLPTLDARDRYSTRPDGYPRGSDGTGSQGISNPTLNTAVTLLEGKIEFDMVRTLHRNTVGAISESLGALMGAMSALTEALDLGERNRGRVTTLQTCQNIFGCSATASGVGEDRLRKGRCQNCYRYLSRHQRDNPNPAQGDVDGVGTS